MVSAPFRVLGNKKSGEWASGKLNGTQYILWHEKKHQEYCEKWSENNKDGKNESKGLLELKATGSGDSIEAAKEDVVKKLKALIHLDVYDKDGVVWKAHHKYEAIDIHDKILSHLPFETAHTHEK